MQERKAAGPVVTPAVQAVSVPVFVITGLGAFLASMDVSLPNGLLPSIGHSVHVDDTAAQAWVCRLDAHRRVALDRRAASLLRGPIPTAARRKWAWELSQVHPDAPCRESHAAAHTHLSGRESRRYAAFF